MKLRVLHLVCLPILGSLLVTNDSLGRGRGAARGGAYRGAGGGAVRGGASYRGVSGPGYRGSTANRSSAYRTSSGGYRSRSATTTRTLTPGGASTRGSGSFSHTTRGGFTVQGGGAAARRTGPLGGARGGAVGGVQVTSPSGQSATRAGTRRATVGPAGGTRVGGSTVRATSGPRGTAAGGVHRSAVRTPGGAGVSRTGTAVRVPSHGGLSRYTRSTTAVSGRLGTVYRSNTAVRTQAVGVRRNYVYRGAFSPTFYTQHPACWRPVRWRPAVRVWTPCTWPVLVGYCSFPAQPVYYDYGATVVYQGDTVYVQGNQVGSAQQYAQQAETIAEQGAKVEPAKDEEWQSLGVFAMVQGDKEDTNNIFQLAVNKAGIIRGNYYNALSDATTPVQGSVDSKSLRAAWTVGDKKNPVYEAGIANLTKEETSMMVHFGEGNSQQWLLVRLEEPKEETK